MCSSLSSKGSCSQLIVFRSQSVPEGVELRLKDPPPVTRTESESRIRRLTRKADALFCEHAVLRLGNFAQARDAFLELRRDLVEISKGIVGHVRAYMPRLTAPSTDPLTTPKASSLQVLAGEPSEPMTREQFDAARKRLKASLDQIVTIDKKEFQRLIDEVIWLKRRLHRVSDARYATRARSPALRPERTSRTNSCCSSAEYRF